MKTAQTLLKQATSHIFMVRPAHFGYNPETADSNAFQERIPDISKTETRGRATEEFDLFVERLRAAGIKVTVFDDPPSPFTPDAVFPNNWITFHQDGTIVLYPMMAPNRRLERRSDIVDHFREYYPAMRVLDLSHFEDEGHFLEGTGSLVLDRIYQIAYACLSPRTDRKLFEIWCREMGWNGVLFHATDADGQEIYHTNVMMALGSGFCVICLEAIKDQNERKEVVDSLSRTGKEIVPITFDQMLNFAGNMLQLRNEKGESVIVMSRQANESLNADQIASLLRHGQILIAPVDLIETQGGGSVRCMMAEVFTEIPGGDADLSGGS